jgi:hypothetical protein
VSSNVGVSNKYDVSKGYIDGNTAILVFRVVRQFKLVIRNNSENIAYYPKLTLDTTSPKFSKLESLNELIPISTDDTIELIAESTNTRSVKEKTVVMWQHSPKNLKT